MVAGTRKTVRMPAVPVPRLSDGVVTVRGAREADIPDLVAACRDPEIPRWTRVPSPYTREDAARFLAVAATDAAAGEAVALAIAGADDDRFAGTIGLMGLGAGDGRGEIGYWLAAAARGRGLTTRAVVLVRDWAVAALGVRELEILAHRDNPASARVAERADFIATGEERSLARMPPGKRDGYRVLRWTP